MSGREQRGDPVTRLLLLLADLLGRYVEGDETALENLGERIEQEGLTLEDVQTATLMLARTAVMPRGEIAVTDAPGERTLRILSHEESESLTPEAWGLLINLKLRGALNAEQLEQVLELLVDSGMRPAGVDVARAVAAQVALDVGPAEGAEGMFHDDSERAH